MTGFNYEKRKYRIAAFKAFWEDSQGAFFVLRDRDDDSVVYFATRNEDLIRKGLFAFITEKDLVIRGLKVPVYSSCFITDVDLFYGVEKDKEEETEE